MTTTQTTPVDNIVPRVAEGFYQTNTATKAEGWPEDSNTWSHLLSVTHNNTSNYYALQFAGGYFDNDHFYIRKTSGDVNTGGNAPWRELWHSGNLTKEVLNVADFGASPSASFNTNLAAFQQAYDACPPNGAIRVPPGTWDYGTPSGTKFVRWLTDGARYVNGSPMTLPGLVDGLYQNRVLMTKTGTPSDTLAILDLQAMGFAGGSKDNLGSTLSATYRAQPGQTTGAWTTTFVMESNSTNENDSVQNSALAVVAKQQVFNGTSLFGANIEASEFHQQANPTTNLLGAEIAVLATGTDDNDVRTGLFLPFQRRFKDIPGTVEFFAGLRMKTDSAKVKRGFLIEGSYDCVFRVEGANSTSAVFDIAQDGCQRALVMNGNQRALWLDWQGTEIASVGVDPVGVHNLTGAGVVAGGSPPPTNVACYLPIIYNGQRLYMPMYYGSQIGQP